MNLEQVQARLRTIEEDIESLYRSKSLFKQQYRICCGTKCINPGTASSGGFYFCDECQEMLAKAEGKY